VIDNDKKIQGTVTEQLVLLEQCSLFAVQEQDGFYLIISANEQACKDDVFIRKGQNVQVQGGLLEGKKIKGVIVAEKSQIKLQ
jgi:phage-related protein